LPIRLPIRSGSALILLSAPAMSAHDRRRGSAAARIDADLREIHHLLDGFAVELRKLDEALETLAAYLVRLQSQAISGDRTLH
jgi:hypothetical protein